MNIGYIGLGSMGGALARRLVGCHRLVVWDLNTAATAALEKEGATVALSAADLARQCDIVLLCLPRSSDVRALVLGAGGLAEGLSAGKIVVDQTSGLPAETRDIAAQLAFQGVAMIDAPVSGGIAGAAAGTITIMLSGPEATCARALPVMAAISNNVLRCGVRVGDGQAMKLVNNLLSAGCRVATLEVVALGRRMGLSLGAITDALNRGHGCNRTTRVSLQGLVNGKPATSAFAMALMVKDLNQAIQLGMQCSAPTPLTQLTRGLLQIGVSTLGQNAQLDKVVDLIGSLAGTQIADAAGAPPTPENADHLLALIESTVASCNELLTYEAVAIGLKYGLALRDIDTVVNKSTGWSAASERILPALLHGRADDGELLKRRIDDLQAAKRLGMQWGAPMLLANTVGALFQLGGHALGADARVDDIARFWETMADVPLRALPEAPVSSH